MITTQIVQEFYSCISNKKLLILVSTDVDAICTTKILIDLLHSDNTQYVIIPVQDKNSLLRAYQENSHIRDFVLINCGANFDIVEYLNPSRDSKFFVIDNHRPIDVYNIYNSEQVVIIVDEDEEKNFPDYEDIFPIDENEDETVDEGEGPDPTAAAGRNDPTNKIIRDLAKRKKRLKADEKRQKILFQYTEFSYYASPTSLLLYNVSWMLSKETNSLLWCAIVGLTNDFLNKRIQTEKYISQLSKLKNHVNRLNHKKDNSNKEKIFIKLISELNLSMYRHWTLFDSLYYSQHIACHFKIWSAQGRKRLNEFLADIGIPLNQCKQKFVCMDFEYRKNAKAWIEEFADKYGIEDINYPSFTIAFGYNKLFGASDYSLALSSLLESSHANIASALGGHETETEAHPNFYATLDCLTASNEFRNLYLGIELAKVQKKRIFDEALSLLEMHQILTVGPFLYASFPEHSMGSNYFSKFISLQSLSHFLLYAYCAKHGSKKTKNLPIALLIPHQTNGSEAEHCTIIGVPPISIIETSSKNFLGKAFEQAAHNTNVNIMVRYFDPTLIVIKNKDKSKFFDALVAMLD